MELLKEEENNRCNIKIERNRGIRAIKKQKQQEFINMDTLKEEIHNRNKIKNKQYREFRAITQKQDRDLFSINVNKSYTKEEKEDEYFTPFNLEEEILHDKGIINLEKA